ncbi:MAG: DUF559 domain-containing protein [Solirubrobacteraceae bacterium]|nr:DUF559 domain-containing protein [Solirubrobacteraceae bacterium]
MRQIVELGLSASAVRSRVAVGRLHRVHTGVVALVPPALLTRKGRIAAATLACRPGSAASHRAAAFLRELRLRGRGWIDVTTPGSPGHRRADGIRVHCGATLAKRDVEEVDGIPCTTLARTLLDIAEDATQREVERALDRAAELRVLDVSAIGDVLQRADGRRGAALLRAVLADHRAGSTLTRNELEELFLAIGRAEGVAPDAVNAWIPYPDGGGAEGDFVWHGQRLVVEVDGRDVHTTRRAFEHDRRRDQRLMLLGWRVVRFTWRQVTFDRAYVATTLRGLLSARREAPGSPPSGA